MKITTIVGARPQFIKAATISPLLKEAGIEEYLIHTGQHYDREMSDVFFDELGMKAPDCNLEINNLSHGAMTGRMIEQIEQKLFDLNPDMILIYGDTNSTMAGAIAASKLDIPVAHVEAGMRSFNTKMPEEVNRLVADQLSTYLFCSTEGAVKNLHQENNPGHIHLVGDVMVDLIREQLIDAKPLHFGDYILTTIHRQENTDDPIKLHNIFAGLRLLSKQVRVIMPLHPRTKKQIEKYNIDTDSIGIIDPLSYKEMLRYEKYSQAIVTDSGGIQKEAYCCNVPCITIRDQTEWTELITHRYNQLIKPNSDVIYRTVMEATETNSMLNQQYNMSLYPPHAAQTIVGLISKIKTFKGPPYEYQ